VIAALVGRRLVVEIRQKAPPLPGKGKLERPAVKQFAGQRDALVQTFLNGAYRNYLLGTSPPSRYRQFMHLHVDMLHEIGRRMAASDPLHNVLDRVVEFCASVVPCDSCFIYVLENQDLVLRASQNPHPGVIDRLKLAVGQGITGWVAEHREPVAVAESAFRDPRFQSFGELPEDRFEAFLSVPVLCRGQVVGVINLQHRLPHRHTPEEIKFVSTIGFLVGAEIERARLEGEVSELTGRLESRKIVERAKGILQLTLGVSEEAAYHALQRQSRQRRMPMKDVAAAIILAEEIRGGPT
jgi:uroporphyrinogen-III synthase